MALKALQTSPLGTTLVGKLRSDNGKKETLKAVADCPKLSSDKSKAKSRLNILPRAARASKKEKPLPKKNAAAGKKDVGVGTDPSPTVDCEMNTELSMTQFANDGGTGNDQKPEDVVKMLKSAVPCDRYFELIAEERRKALDEALLENLRLSQEIAALREENAQLRMLAEEGVRYAELLREAIGDGTEDQPAS